VIPRRRLLAPLTGLALTALLPACGGTAAPAPAAAPTAAPAAKPAPELEGLQWYNSPPLTLIALRGRPVLLVFWSTI
jgi:hypothetical protein